MVWTTPLVATLGMSLTIPLAMVADMMIHGRHYSAVYILGSTQVCYCHIYAYFLTEIMYELFIFFLYMLQVFAGFVIANLSDWLSKKLGL